MTNIEKVIRLITSLDTFEKPEHLVVKDNKLYIATWDVDYHNGDIDNYVERLATNKEAGANISKLEEEYASQKWKEYKRSMKKKFVEELYNDNKLAKP